MVAKLLIKILGCQYFVNILKEKSLKLKISY